MLAVNCIRKAGGFNVEPVGGQSEEQRREIGDLVIFFDLFGESSTAVIQGQMAVNSPSRSASRTSAKSGNEGLRILHEYSSAPI